MAEHNKSLMVGKNGRPRIKGLNSQKTHASNTTGTLSISTTPQCRTKTLRVPTEDKTIPREKKIYLCADKWRHNV